MTPSLRLLCLSLLVCGAAEAAQPIRYRHKAHLQLGLKCADCHALPGKGAAAGFPPESKCMACHATVKRDSPEIRKLAEFAQKGAPVPWERVYRLPANVWFSHKLHHVSAKIGCETCHGPVAEREVIVREKPIDMKSCMECHEERNAPVECNVCHNP